MLVDFTKRGIRNKAYEHVICKHVQTENTRNETIFRKFVKHFSGHRGNSSSQTIWRVKNGIITEEALEKGLVSKGMLDKKKEENNAKEEYMSKFMKEEKIVYTNFLALKENCLKKLKNLKCDLFIHTSSNREYVPYHFYDFFVSARSLKYDNFFKKEEENRKVHVTEGHQNPTTNVGKFSIEKKDMIPLNASEASSEIHRFKLFEHFIKYKDVDNIDMDSYIKLSLKKNFQIKYLTTVQYCILPFFLENYDLLIHSVKGSGKTVAYMVSLLHKIIIQMSKLHNFINWDGSSGVTKERDASFVFALIICPNIILVEQTYKVVKKLIMYHPYNVKCHYLHGRKSNMNMKKEVEEMKRRKPNIIVTTPISFMNHVKYSQNFLQQFFLCDTLIIDEAYFLLDSNYLKTILQIKDVLPKGHQSILLTTIVNNFLKQICYRILRLHYVYLNFVDNTIYEEVRDVAEEEEEEDNKSNVNKIGSAVNIDNNDNVKKKENQDYNCYVKNTVNKDSPVLTCLLDNTGNIDQDNIKDNDIFITPIRLQLYHHINARMLHVYKDNILNCDDVRKLWFSKNAKTFFEKVRKTGVYIGKDDTNEEHNNVIAESNKESDDCIQEEYIFPLSKYSNNPVLNPLKTNCEPHIKNSDYNKYKMYNNKMKNEKNEQNKGKNIPTHIFLKQEYLIYESDKFGLVLFNIIYKEFLEKENMKVVIFFPTVKMLQFFYSLFKHYIFKGYLFLLYMKLNRWEIRVGESEEAGMKGLSSNTLSDNGSNNLSSVLFTESRKQEKPCYVSSNAFILNGSPLEQEDTYKIGDIKQKLFQKNRKKEHTKNEAETYKKCEETEEYIRQLNTFRDIYISCIHSKLSLEKKLYTLKTFNSTEKKKQILFSSSLLYQGIELDKVDLVIHVGISNSTDEYILRTQIATDKNTCGRSLLLLHELEGHYLFILYKNSIMINNVSPEYLEEVYTDRKFLNILLKYKRERFDIAVPTSNYMEPIKKEKEEVSKCKSQTREMMEEEPNETNEKTNTNIHGGDDNPLKHIEWHSHKHLRASCELMYRSVLGFYCEKSKYLKYEKWQVPSLIKNMLYSLGFFENFYITKEMAARLQILGAPDVFINYNAKSKSVLVSALPSYKSYISKMNEWNQKKTEEEKVSRATPKSKLRSKSSSIFNHSDMMNPLETEGENDICLKKDQKENPSKISDCKNYYSDTLPLYIPLQKYVS